MLACLNKEDLLRLAEKAKMVSHAPPKVVVAPTSTEDDEETASGFVFTRKRGRAQATSSMLSPSRGQVASNAASPSQPPHIPVATPCLLEVGERARGEKAFETRMSMLPPSWRMPSCAPRTRREWMPTVANTYCKRL